MKMKRRSDMQKQKGATREGSLDHCGYELVKYSKGWIMKSGCGQETDALEGEVALWSFCPYCGSRCFIEEQEL